MSQVKNLINNFWGYIFKEDDSNKDKSTVEILKQIPLTAKMTKSELKKVASILYDRTYEKDEYMFEKEQPGAAMFIIKSGSINITVPEADGKELVLATLPKGTFVGELALLDDSPRSASAKATEKTEALAFFRTDLNKLLETEPSIASKILSELALIIGKRLKATNDQLYGKVED